MQATRGTRSGSARARSENRAVVEALYDVTVAARRLSSRDPIDTGSVRVLWQLADAGRCRLSDLAELVSLDLSTVSRHVRELVDAGYVDRTPDTSDRRAAKLEISPAGREVLAVSLQNRIAAVSPVLDHWAPDERAHLARLLRALADDLNAFPPTPTTTTDHEDFA